MKKIILFIAMAGIFAACSDDSSNSTTDSEIDETLLIGKWDLISLKHGSENIIINDCDYGTWKEYKTNGSLVEEYKCDNTPYTETSSFTLSGHTITNIWPEDTNNPYVFEILQLTSDILEYRYDYVDEDNTPQSNTFMFLRM